MSILVRYGNFYVKNHLKNNDKMTQFHWSRKSRDSCPTSSTQRNNLHRELASDKTRITKSLASAIASARWRGSHPPRKFQNGGHFFSERNTADGFMLPGPSRGGGGVPGVTTPGPGPKGGPG